MVKLLLLLLLSVGFQQKQPLPKNVYLCTSSASYAYHYDKDCSALVGCSVKLKTLTRAWVVKDKKRKLCSICKKNQERKK
jgi:hypothetical protein